MPVRDCMTSSPFCPANQESKFAIPGLESVGCDTCVEESLKKEEIPKCFFCKIEEGVPLDTNDLSFSNFAKKVMNLKLKSRQ
jgi:hypothetical protein